MGAQKDRKRQENAKYGPSVACMGLPLESPPLHADSLRCAGSRGLDPETRWLMQTPPAGVASAGFSRPRCEGGCQPLRSANGVPEHRDLQRHRDSIYFHWCLQRMEGKGRSIGRKARLMSRAVLALSPIMIPLSSSTWIYRNNKEDKSHC